MMRFHRRVPFAHVLCFGADAFTRASALDLPPSNPRSPGRQAVHKEEKYPSTYNDRFFGRKSPVLKNIFFKAGF